MSTFYNRVARALPVSFQDRADRQVKEAGLREDSTTWLAKTTIVTFLFAVIGGLEGYFLHSFINAWLGNLLPGIMLPLEITIFLGLIIGFLAGIIVRMLVLYYSIENRRRKVEEILPDFLLLVAGNIRAGMTSFSAFKSSSRPEFGPLAEEVRTVTTRALGTESFGNALSTISQRIKSRSLSETVRFFLQAVRSGGKVAQILENTSSDLRRTQDLKKELESSTRTYVIFVAFVMVIATPLLMAVSVEFVTLITRIQSQNTFLTTDAASSSVGFLTGTLTITPAFLESAAYILLFGNAILAGLFIGVIGQGKPLLGLRYTIPMFVISVIGFGIARIVLGGILGSPSA